MIKLSNQPMGSRVAQGNNLQTYLIQWMELFYSWDLLSHLNIGDFMQV